MHSQHGIIAIIGFGEAGSAFAGGLVARGWPVRAFDVKTAHAATRVGQLAAYETTGVAGCETAGKAVAGAGLVLSVVTADQAVAAADAAARGVEQGALFCDMNSVPPGTKRDACALIEQAGGRYADVAVMSPVLPAGMGAPLLVSGAHAEDAAQALRAAGFADVTALAAPVGAASAIKLLRSVMVKGIEALCAECFLAAEAAGASARVIASLDASWPGADWARRGDYNLERMMRHGMRRAAEMEEALKLLEELGVGGAMTKGTIAWQREIGGRALPAAGGLADKATALLAHEARAA